MQQAALWVAIILAHAGTLSVYAAVSEPVQLESGAVSGMPGQAPEMRIFKAIPFAEPPVGNLRWRATARRALGGSAQGGGV